MNFAELHYQSDITTRFLRHLNQGTLTSALVLTQTQKVHSLLLGKYYCTSDLLFDRYENLFCKLGHEFAIDLVIKTA